MIVTGPAGAGRSTAIGALEDLGFEAIDNMPIGLLPRLFSAALERPVAVGIDPRNRDFSIDRMLTALTEVAAVAGRAPVLVYLDCDATTLAQRYSETRRRHPLSPRESPLVGIGRDLTLLTPLRGRADILIDTSSMTPHELRAEMERQFGEDRGQGQLAVTLQSFSYKRGVPRGVDMVLDVRFLKNPHWDPSLRGRDGRDPQVRAYIEADPAYEPFYTRMADLVEFLLPAYRAEGKSYFVLGIGCTGGKHRSVALVEALAKTLAREGWQVSIRHRDLERAADVSVDLGMGVA